MLIHVCLCVQPTAASNHWTDLNEMWYKLLLPWNTGPHRYCVDWSEILLGRILGNLQVDEELLVERQIIPIEVKWWCKPGVFKFNTAALMIPYLNYPLNSYRQRNYLSSIK